MKLDEAVKKELLDLSAKKGNAEKTLDLFLEIASPALNVMKIEDTLLGMIYKSRKYKSGDKRIHMTKCNEKELCKVYCSLCLKIVQNILKAYVSRCSGIDSSKEDIGTAMDLATMSLSLLIKFEKQIRVGELVIENMLYQIAKKYTEIANNYSSVICVLACIHLRVWDFHAKLCAQLNQENTPSDLLQQIREKKIKLDIYHINVICHNPRPQSFHSALYARLLIGVLNVVLTMLHTLQEHKMLLQLAKDEFRPWLDYLASTPGIDKKVIVSNNDRMFRILWKCAAAIEKKEVNINETLVYRSAAVEYMAQCPTYTKPYCLQQIYRVGLQYERCISQSSKSGSYAALCDFYIKSFESLKLSENHSKDIDPDFVVWMEHFASICEKLKSFSDQIMLLDIQLCFLEELQNSELWRIPVELSLGILLAEIGLKKKSIKRSEYSKRICNLYPRAQDNFSNMGKVKPSYRKSLSDLLNIVSQEKKTPENCLRVAKAILTEVARLEISKAVSNSSTNSKLIPFLLRLAKRNVMNLYNLTLEHPVEMHSHTLISHFAHLFEMIPRSLDSSLDTDRNSIEVCEVRFRRLAVSLAMKSYCNFSEKSMIENVDVLDQLREHTSALCRMRSLKQLDPTIKGDIHAVVRDIYSAGLRLHKEKAMDESVAIITQSQILLSYEDEQLKTGESIYTLLSYSLRELNNLPQSRRMLINALGFCDETVPVRNIEKLIAIILEESLALDPSCSQSYVVDIKTCLTDLLSVFKQRQIPSTFQQDVLMYLQYSLEQSCHRILSDLRTISSNRINIESTSKLKGLKALVLVRNAVWALLLEGSESNPRFLLQSALGKRLYIFGSYYCQKEPIVFREECAVVIETLRDIGKGSSLEKSNMIRAEASTWHMVILLEMTLLLNYTGTMGTNPMVFDELCRNVALWKDVIEKQQLDSRFGDQCIQALEAFVACLGALNLPEVKSQFLEIESQVRERIGTNAPFVRLPVYLALPFCMLNSYKPVDSDRIEMSGVRREYKDENVSQLYRIDYLLHESSQMLYGKEITSRFDGKCEILKEIIEALELLKSKQININQNLSFYKAIGMREIMVYITLSNVHFDRGDWQYAAEEAKMALALVWKLARKFCHEATKGEKVMANTRHFIIPDEMLPRSISHSVHADESRMLMQSKNKSLIYFQAQEYELWEILQVTRHILCYLGDIYSLAGNVYKSTTYFSEALSLTGGLHSFGFLHNQVVLEYSKFHLQCGRNIQARRTLEILDKNYQKEIAARYSASIENFVPLRLQYCIEMIQRGDIQNEAADAISFYEKGLKVLDKLPNTSKQCHMRVRIYRGIVTSLYIQYEDSNHNDFSVRQSLTNYLGELKSLLNKCEDKIERCMGICELTRINLLLLYKGNNENIMSLEECILILEEAFDLSSALGVLYTQQCTRKVLGVAYHLKNERLSSESSLEANRFRFACASLMTNIFSHTEKNVNSVHQSKEQDIYSRLQILSLSQQEKKSISFLNEWVQNFRDKIMSDFLPSNWNVISISTGLDRDQLIITRITKGKIPVCFKLDDMPWKKWVDEINAILKKSKKSLVGASSDESLEWSSDQKKDWWNLRKELDERLGRLMKQLEINLGFWKCLLVPQKSPSSTSFIECLKKESKQLTYEQTELLECLVMNPNMDDEEKIQGYRRIFPTLSLAELEEKMVALKSRVFLINESSMSQVKPCNIPASQKHEYLISLTQEHLNRMKVVDLKVIAARLNINSSGLKKNIIERIMEVRNNAMLRKISAQKTSKEQVHNAPSYQGAATILILDTPLQEIPWEGLDGLKNYTVTRMPSLQLLFEMCNEIKNKNSTKLLRRDRVSYVLNPSGDLSTTEKSLQPILQSASSKFGWKGVIGKPPDAQEMRNYLLESDLFIYCGHGAGEKYFHRDQILKLKGSSCSAAFLFGCSSGRLEKEGIFGPNGTVMSYLTAGSPAILAMLWDVTDRDVDRLSMRILEDWVLSEEEKNDICLGEMLQQSRSVCKLKNLNGLAAVCYGIPVRMTS